MVKITKLKSCLTQANVGRKLLKLLFCVNINFPMSGSEICKCDENIVIDAIKVE